MTLIQVEGVTIDLKTAPYDARFPNVNQTKHCWQKFVDYVKCNKMLGEEAAACKEMKLHAQIICPQPWVSKIFNCLWRVFIAASFKSISAVDINL